MSVSDGSARRVARLSESAGVHAVLLYGTEGAPHFELANTLARTWICDPGAPEDPQGDSFDRGTHPDFLRVPPTGPSRIIRVIQIVPREPKPKDQPHIPIREFIRIAPLRSRHKVVLIEHADRLNSDGANALLKIVEEPPAFLKFIFVTDTISRVLPTILSRCVVMGVTAEPPDPARGALFAAMPHLADSILSSPMREEQFERLLAQLGDPRAVLRLSDEIREFAAGLEEYGKVGGRELQARTVEALAYAVRGRFPERPQWTEALLDAHRLIQGNVATNLVLDATLAKLT